MSKIWIFNHYAHPPNIPGGTRHFDVSRELVKRGHEVTIFISSFIHEKGIDVLADNERYKEEFCDGVRFVWVKTSGYQANDFRRIKNMLTYAWRTVFLGLKYQRPDVIIGSSVHPLACLAAYVVSRWYKCRNILEIRDLWPETLVDMGALPRKHIVTQGLYLLEKFLCKRAERIIVLMPGAVDYVADLGIEKNKIMHIPNGVDIEAFDENKAKYDIQSLCNIADYKDKFKVFYTGSHGPLDSLETVLESARILQEEKIDEIAFLFFGYGPSKQDLVKIAQEYQLKNVHFYDAVKKDQVACLLASADLLLATMKNLALYKYGISFNKLFDYFASAKPVILTGQVLNDMVKEANAGISTQPEDAQQLAEAIKKVYNLGELERMQLGKNAREYVKKKHNISVIADNFEKIIL